MSLSLLFCEIFDFMGKFFMGWLLIYTIWTFLRELVFNETTKRAEFYEPIVLSDRVFFWNLREKMIFHRRYDNGWLFTTLGFWGFFIGIFGIFELVSYIADRPDIQGKVVIDIMFKTIGAIFLIGSCCAAIEKMWNMLREKDLKSKWLIDLFMLPFVLYARTNRYKSKALYNDLKDGEE